MYALVENNKIVKQYNRLDEVRSDLNISLPEAPTEEQLNEFNVYTVIDSIPEYDPTTHHVVAGDVVFQDGSCLLLHTVVENEIPEILVPEEIDPIFLVKEQAKQILQKTDWTQLPDSGISNVEEFKVYRLQVRNILLNPTADVVFPVPPSSVWEPIEVPPYEIHMPVVDLPVIESTTD